MLDQGSLSMSRHFESKEARTSQFHAVLHLVAVGYHITNDVDDAALADEKLALGEDAKRIVKAEAPDLRPVVVPLVEFAVA